MKSVQSLLFFKPMKEEPPEWVTAFGWSVFTPDGHISGRGIDNGLPCEMAFKLPYRPGEKCYVREIWALPDPTDRTCICYQALEHPITTGEKWRSPVTMPQWASRRHVRIISCVPEQRGEWGWKMEWEENNAL